jgi:acetoacetate decarboxylase
MTVRYGARPVRTDPEVELTTRSITSSGLDIVYETDPEIVAAVLPPPLRPASEPLVRLQIMGVTMGDGELFASGNFTVRAAHEDTEGAYCLFMPQPTEPIVVGGRETYGEPKKIADISLERDGDTVRAEIARYGMPLFQVEGTVGAAIDPPPPGIELEYYFKYLRDPAGHGLTDPHLVYCDYDRQVLELRRFDGTLTLGESPVDPVADIVVRRVRSMTWFTRQSAQTGRIKQRVDGDALLPYVHQKYDDLAAVHEALMATAGS